MKTFKDLTFKTREGFLKENKQALIHFENGYSVSVLFGKAFYSNGVDTYELAVLYKGLLTYSNSFKFVTEVLYDDNVLGYINEIEVSNIMNQVQALK